MFRARFLGFLNLRGALDMEPKRESGLGSDAGLLLLWNGPQYEFEDAGVSGEVPGVSKLEGGPSNDAAVVGEDVVDDVDVLDL